MKKIVLALFLIVILTAPSLAAELPKLISFQGELTDASGRVVTGTPAIEFKIYDVATGGAAIWTENHGAVMVSNGVFNVELGSITPLTLSFDTSYWVSINVDGDGEMLPRHRLLTTPYAYYATTADTAFILADGAISYGELTVADTLLVGTTATIGDTLTVNDGFLVDGTTLYVNAPADRVGVGTTTPTHTMTVVGDLVADSSTFVVRSASNQVQISNTTPFDTALVVHGNFAVIEPVTHGGLLNRPILTVSRHPLTMGSPGGVEVAIGTPNSWNFRDTAALSINGFLCLQNAPWFNDPTTSPNDGIVMWASDTGFGAELLARDENGNKTRLAPHDFDIAPRSEDIAWAFTSSNDNIGKKINVDMLRVMRVIERLSGEKLVYIEGLGGMPVADPESLEDYRMAGNVSLVDVIDRLEAENEEQQTQLDQVLEENSELREQLAEVLERLGALEKMD